MLHFKRLFLFGDPQSEDFEEEDAIFFAGLDRDATSPGTAVAVNQIDLALLLCQQRDSGLFFIQLQCHALGVGRGGLQIGRGRGPIDGKDLDPLEQRGGHRIKRATAGSTIAGISASGGTGQIDVVDRHFDVDVLSSLELEIECCGGGTDLNDDRTFALFHLKFRKVSG